MKMLFSYTTVRFEYDNKGTLLSRSLYCLRSKPERMQRFYGPYELCGDTITAIHFDNGYYDSKGKVYYHIADYQGNVTSVMRGDGTTVQTAAYYPYGEPWLEPEGSNRRLFTGKERLTDLGISLSDYGARLLNHRTIGWTTQDPCAEDFRWLSPYSVCGSDPINYVDLDGNIFTAASEPGVNRLLSECFYKILMAESISEYATVMAEIVIMYNSPQLFHIKTTSPLGDVGATVYDKDKDAVVFYIPGGAYGDLGLIAHEFKHGFQFLIGEMDLKVVGLDSKYNLYYDLTDEVAAYERGELFGGPNYSEEEIAALYPELPKKRLNYYDISNYDEQKKPEYLKAGLANLANKYKIAMRIKNTTYKPQ